MKLLTKTTSSKATVSLLPFLFYIFWVTHLFLGTRTVKRTASEAVDAFAAPSRVGSVSVLILYCIFFSNWIFTNLYLPCYVWISSWRRLLSENRCPLHFSSPTLSLQRLFNNYCSITPNVIIFTVSRKLWPRLLMFMWCFRGCDTPAGWSN